MHRRCGRLAAMRGLVFALVLVAYGCSTTKNPKFCCLTEADCRAAGATELSPCAEGLACLDHACEPAQCAMSGCAPEAPICEAATDTCVGCSVAGDCARFSETRVCDLDGGGACVECLTAADCEAGKPVCDAKQCRTCALDTECVSGACGDDGACVDEASVVYLDPNGVDAAPCAKSAPCRTHRFGIEQLSVARPHLVFATGSYVLLREAVATAPASGVWIHGHGAQVSGGTTDVATFRFNVPATIRDLEITNPNVEGFALHTNAATTIDRVKLTGEKGLATTAALNARDFEVATTNIGIVNSGALVVDRARVHGGATGLTSTAGTIDLRNTMIFNTTQIGVDLQNTGGVIEFSTIARTGLSTAEGETFGVRCGNTVTVRSSIVWTFFTVNATAHVPITQCPTIEGGSIIGPMAVGGATNTNPSFLNEASFDFHINGNSPAHDAATQGPTSDFEGDPRPRGLAFDVGADEAP